MSMIFVLSLFLSATNAPATVEVATTEKTETGKSQEPAQVAKKKKPKKICRTDTQDTGSRIRKSICKTAEEWESEANSDELEVKSQGY